MMVINEEFTEVKAYMLVKRNLGMVPNRQIGELILRLEGAVWYLTDLVYNFLQVLLINYFAQRKEGVIIHSAVSGRGYAFVGKSGTGKSTITRLWHRYSEALILNDDRIIVCKSKNKFLIYESPWYGEFSDYSVKQVSSVVLEGVFFIYHATQNKIRQISRKEFIRFIYPKLFLTFWDKKYIENIILFCEDMKYRLPFYELGFMNDKNIISFVRKICLKR